jgi:hypothetical protein
MGGGLQPSIEAVQSWSVSLKGKIWGEKNIVSKFLFYLGKRVFSITVERASLPTVSGQASYLNTLR